MKMKPEHFEILKRALDRANMKDPAAFARYEARGLTHFRFRWDTTFSIQHDGKPLGDWICKELYPYLNDNNIDTALRQYFEVSQ